ncbi:putative O-glycosylation ligase, exosortase A system-associated [Sphingosinicella sp. LHD-64]|uniref:putative O-glycosylation ligase, exosortase A system-associated n=1 Tax=Sphingosinicella sp. LHD-64 TaxID=3072139 RepID=UPI00280D870B|nr:putative O-glycosylation ligase, exosortase A system-associated [Sphingosinicella sp. LHD-64]MDQ8757500.1 putative O-glycosylation ligase, exosortase A system-associated [Sphingosinicella sp. LHD-64]
MRDLVFIAFLAAFGGLALWRPFFFVLAYAYVDIVSPQRLSYYLLNSIPVSMIFAALAVGAWLLFDPKHGARVAPRQMLMLILLGYAGFTTMHADMPIPAWEKWDWAWKALAFGIFLPFTLRTRVRIEAILLFMTLSAAAIIIVGGIKTAVSGGGYGVLNLMVDNNSGLYESSIISTFAIALIPVIFWFARYGTIFPPDWRTRLFCGALIFACLLIPVGTEARTGLVCIAVVAVLMLRDVKRRFLYLCAIGTLGLAAVPFLPSSFTDRMQTIQGYQADQSAGTRLAVWGWTLNYVQDRPLGGGFEAYLQNRIQVEVTNERSTGDVQMVNTSTQADAGRAWHSSYFEMLGEQGWPGLFLFLLIHVIGLVRMEMIRRRYARREDVPWIAPLATALQHFQIVYLVGSAFVQTAWQPFAWMMIGAQIGFDLWVARREREARGTQGWAQSPVPVAAQAG